MLYDRDLNDYKKAVEHYNRAIEIDEKNIQLKFWRDLALEKLKEQE